MTAVRLPTRVRPLLFAALAIGAPVAGLSAASARPPLLWAMLHGADPVVTRDLVESGVIGSDGVLRQLMRNGVRARHLVPTEPALTSSGRASTLTGARPSEHGVVGNLFRQAGSPVDGQVSGFQLPFQVEAIWQSAQRQGRGVVRIGSLFGHEQTEAGDSALLSGQPLTTTRVIALAPSETPQPLASFEHGARLSAGEGESRLMIGAPGGPFAPLAINLMAVDGVADGRHAFDRVLLDLDRDPGNGALTTLQPGRWAPIAVRSESPCIGLWLKLIELDPIAGTGRLYVGPAVQGRGYPIAFQQAMEAELGCYPGAPDYNQLAAGLIDAQTWLEQMERENLYLRDAALLAARRRPFDLMIFEQPAIDNVVHQFLLTDPRQAGFADAEARARSRSYVERAYRLVDRHVATLLDALGAGAGLLMSSDYSLQPVHRRYDINAILAQGGFAPRGDSALLVRGIASSTSAHIYFNRAGAGDDVDWHDRSRRITALFRDFRDEAGNPVFDRVLTADQQRRAGLFFAERSGDIWVQARPGYSLSSRRERLETLSDAPPLPGEHGYHFRGGDGAGLLIARSPSSPAASVGPVPATDLAGIVSAWLGVQPRCDARRLSRNGRSVLAALGVQPRPAARC